MELSEPLYSGFNSSLLPSVLWLAGNKLFWEDAVNKLETPHKGFPSSLASRLPNTNLLLTCIWVILTKGLFWFQDIVYTRTHTHTHTYIYRERERHTGKFLAKNNKFSSDIKPPPLQKITLSTISKPIGRKIKEKAEFQWQRRYWIYLKSVDGSFPCQPISFHCSDIKPRSSSSGKAAFHKALKASWSRLAIQVIFTPSVYQSVLMNHLHRWKAKTCAYPPNKDNRFTVIKWNPWHHIYLVLRNWAVIGNIHPALESLQAFLLTEWKKTEVHNNLTTDI